MHPRELSFLFFSFVLRARRKNEAEDSSTVRNKVEVFFINNEIITIANEIKRSEFIFTLI